MESFFIFQIIIFFYYYYYFLSLAFGELEIFTLCFLFRFLILEEMAIAGFVITN
jgi:hypothetical protein